MTADDDYGHCTRSFSVLVSNATTSYLLTTLVSTLRRRRIVRRMFWSVQIDSRCRLSGVINVFDRRNLTRNLGRRYDLCGLGQFLNRNVLRLWNKTNVKEKSFSVRKIQKRMVHVIISNNIFLKNIRANCDVSIIARLQANASTVYSYQLLYF